MKALTTKDAAAVLGISLRQVQTLIKQGRLPAHKMGRDYIIKESDLRLVSHRPKGRPRKVAVESDAKSDKPGSKRKNSRHR